MRSLIRWNPQPVREVADPFRAVESLFDELWQSWPTLATDTRRPFLRPAMDVIENDHDVTVRIDLPGLSPDDVNIEVEDHMLTVRGEFGDNIEQKGDRYHYRERSVGMFQRSVRLPDTLDTDKIEATFTNGVLNIVLPKLPQAQPKQIKVKADKK